MTYKNTTNSYGSITKFFHWTVALAVISLLAVGFIMTNLPKDDFRYMIFDYHKLFGLTVLLLMIARLAWMSINTKPALPEEISRWERFAATGTHHSLYSLLVLMPLSGWVMSTAAGYYPKLAGWTLALPGIAKSKSTASTAGDIHEIIAWMLVVLVSVHVLAALKHHFIDKTNILVRMLPSCRCKGTG